MSLQINDRVRIIGSMHNSPHVGKIATVIGAYDGFAISGYMVNLPPSSGIGWNGFAVFRDKHLRKIGDYDGHQKTSWSTCLWSPTTASEGRDT